MSKYIAVSNSDSDLEFINENVGQPPLNKQQPQPPLPPTGLPSPQISRPTIPPPPSPQQQPPPHPSDDYDSDVEFLDEILRPKQAQQQKQPPSPPPRHQTPPITTQFASSHSITLILQPLPQKQRTKNCENDSDKKNLEEPKTRSLVNDDSGDEHEIDEAGIQTDPLANLFGTSGKGPIHRDGQNVLAAMNADKNEVEQSGSGNVEATNVNVGNLIDMAALYKLLEASDQMSEEKTNDDTGNFLIDQKHYTVNKQLSIDADDDDTKGNANMTISQASKPPLSDVIFPSTSTGTSQDNIEGKDHVKTCLLTYSDETSISRDAKRSRLCLHEPDYDENDDDDSGFDFLNKGFKEKAKTVLNMSSADLIKWKFKLSSMKQATAGEILAKSILVDQGKNERKPIQTNNEAKQAKQSTCTGLCIQGQPMLALTAEHLTMQTKPSTSAANCSNLATSHQACDSDSEEIEITDGTGKQSCVNVNSKLTILEKVVLTYPEKGDVCPAKIRGEHMKTLRPNEEVNDEVIRFAFKHAMSLLDTELSKKIALVDPTFGGLAKAILKKEIEYLVYPYLHKNGDIRHWFLVIATGFHKIFQKPLLLKEDRVLHLPYTIAFLNSMPTIGHSSYDKIKKDIEEFFEKKCQEYQKISKVSVKHCGDEAIPELFGQRYGNDCGVYMVEYFKYFFSAQDVRVCLQCPTPYVPKVKMEMELLGDLLRPREKVGKLLRKSWPKRSLTSLRNKMESHFVTN